MTDFTDTLPPPRTLARYAENLTLANKLRTRPGQWEPYPWTITRPRDLRYRIATGQVAAFRDGFEAKIRDGQVFIRYSPKGPQ
ncbi:Uncharacterised protein [Mycobacteroides abscessus subsp. abscessus]|nr:Uncharacterised protein [Mycobacteroides abscessus subsp. abscessus]